MTPPPKSTPAHDAQVETLKHEVATRMQVIEDLQKQIDRQQEIIQRASSVTARLRDEATVTVGQMHTIVKALMLIMQERDLVISKSTLLSGRYMKLMPGSKVGMKDGDVSFNLVDMTPKEREIEESLGKRRDQAEKRITPKKKAP